MTSIDIGTDKKYPSMMLSNFTMHRFMIDYVVCNSMEGFLQSLKFEDIDKQKQICKLTGEIAKFKGKKKKWWLTNVLYWNGVKFHRTSEEYKALIRRAYDCMYVQSHSFRRGLFFSKDAKLKHSIGKKDESRTVLTIDEFIGNLNRLREKGANDVLSN